MKTLKQENVKTYYTYYENVKTITATSTLYWLNITAIFNIYIHIVLEVKIHQLKY